MSSFQNHNSIYTSLMQSVQEAFAVKSEVAKEFNLAYNIVLWMTYVLVDVALLGQSMHFPPSHSFTHSLTHSLTHSHTHLLERLLTHSLTGQSNRFFLTATPYVVFDREKYVTKLATRNGVCNATSVTYMDTGTGDVTIAFDYEGIHPLANFYFACLLLICSLTC